MPASTPTQPTPVPSRRRSLITITLIVVALVLFTLAVKKFAPYLELKMDDKWTIFASVTHGRLEEVKHYVFWEGTDHRDRIERTPLHHAFMNRKWDVAAYLLEHGADPNAKDKYGQSAMEIAWVPGPEAAMLYALALKNGFDPNHLDRNGFSPLDTAHRHGNLELAAVLRAHGAEPQTIHAALGLNDVPTLQRLLQSEDAYIHFMKRPYVLQAEPTPAEEHDGYQLFLESDLPETMGDIAPYASVQNVAKFCAAVSFGDQETMARLWAEGPRPSPEKHWHVGSAAEQNGHVNAFQLWQEWWAEHDAESKAQMQDDLASEKPPTAE
jgi:hypothetical protein